MPEITITQFSDAEMAAKNIISWPIWTKEISCFNWYYQSQEACLILQGEIRVETLTATYHIVAGDFVVFQKGLECTWYVLQPVRKHYQLSSK
ncbi:MAG: cupin domain-containing protein [Bacteroidota bacterium]